MPYFAIHGCDKAVRGKIYMKTTKCIIVFIVCLIIFGLCYCLDISESKAAIISSICFVAFFLLIIIPSIVYVLVVVWKDAKYVAREVKIGDYIEIDGITVSMYNDENITEDTARKVVVDFKSRKNNIERFVVESVYKPLCELDSANVSIDIIGGDQYHVRYNWDDNEYFVCVDIKNGSMVDIYGGD